MFDVSALSCRVSVLLGSDGIQNVLFTEAGRNLQLVVSGSDLVEPARLSSNVLWPPGDVRRRLEGFACLNALRATGRLPAKFFPVEPRSDRLRSVLRALDGSIAGASHRDIGIAMFGSARAERDWADPRDHLRDMVRRAVRRGHSLMNGGYCRFVL